jgi:DNA polymerase-3 subunit gamma/tau
VLDIGEDEAAQWMEWTRRFDPTHVHACWQLTLEGQQRVKGSLEPALALELLLLNLACLTRLLPLGDIARTGAAPAGPAANLPQAGAHPHSEPGCAAHPHRHSA